MSRLRGLSAARPRVGVVFAAYLLITVVMTWPLLPGLLRDVPGDLGDSLLNMWILGWGAELVPRLAAGRASLDDYWNANIFHPEPLALGFSEHLFGEVVQILPVYWVTGNLILCYNLLFLSSFALSGLAMFLLARDLLQASVPGSAGARSGSGLEGRSTVVAAAFIAGLIFAFIPLRIAQVAHIQSLQAQWMPLALYGFRRFIVSGRSMPLAGGTAALLMQNWSNGYYLIYFAPFVLLFVLHQLWAQRQLGNVRIWAGFAIAALLVLAGTWPFLALYLEAQRVHSFARPLDEVVRFSADVYSYLTAPEALRLWGNRVQAYPKAEGELFFGFLPWLLTIASVFIPVLSIAAASDRTRRSLHLWVLAVVIVAQTAGLIAILFTGGFIASLAGLPIRATNATRILIGLVICFGALGALSPGVRARLRMAARSSRFLCAALLLLALWLSLGPQPQSHGRELHGLGLYSLLYEHVPGFAGLRVPARYAMIAAVFLSLLAGYGTRTLVARRGAGVAALIAVAFLGEAWFAPLSRNVTWGDGSVTPPARVEPAADAPAVYHTLAGLREDAVVAEFPFGDPAWELRYVYYSTVHWRRLLNGYSGAFPQAYKTRVALLRRVRENPDEAWRALRDAGTTHVIVHQAAMLKDEAAAIVQWLNEHFAVEIARFNGDVLFDVSGVWPPK